MSNLIPCFYSCTRVPHQVSNFKSRQLKSQEREVRRTKTLPNQVVECSLKIPMIAALRNYPSMRKNKEKSTARVSQSTNCKTCIFSMRANSKKSTKAIRHWGGRPTIVTCSRASYVSICNPRYILRKIWKSLSLPLKAVSSLLQTFRTVSCQC